MADTQQKPQTPTPPPAQPEQKPAQPQAESKQPVDAALLVVEGQRFFLELQRPLFIDGIRKSLPGHVNAELWERHMLTYFRDHESLQQCSLRSIQTALLYCAASGLDLGFGDRAYLVPFWNNTQKVNEARFIPSYKGLIELMRNSGTVRGVRARVVFEGDFIEVIQGTKESLEHRPAWKDAGAPMGAYSVADFQDGSTEFLTMPADEILAVKEQALAKMKNKDGSPWSGPFEGEMWKKTVIRRHAKTLPLSPSTRKALDDLERHEDAPASASIDITGGGTETRSRSERVAATMTKEPAAEAGQ